MYVNFWCFKCKGKVDVDDADVEVVVKPVAKGERTFQKAACPVCGCKLNKIRKKEVTNDGNEREGTDGQRKD